MCFSIAFSVSKDLKGKFFHHGWILSLNYYNKNFYKNNQKKRDTENELKPKFQENLLESLEVRLLKNMYLIRNQPFYVPHQFSYLFLGHSFGCYNFFFTQDLSFKFRETVFFCEIW